MKKRIFLFSFSFIFFAVAVSYVLAQQPVFERLKRQFFPTPVPVYTKITGIGVIGDSQSDEYQADDARGFQYAPRTINWIEQLASNRKLNFGVWNTWGDVRRTGFAYNWSRSGATSASVLANGQHTGMAQQITNGEVNIVIVYIGANDFAPYNTTDGYFPIYSGAVTGQALAEKIDSVVTNIDTTIDTVQTAGNANILLVTVPDWNLSAHIQVGFTDASGRQRVSNAVQTVNNQLREIAKKRNIPVADVNVFYQSLLDRAPLGSISVGDEVVSLLLPGDEPHNAFLSDAIHPGTILNGLFANFIISNLNEKIHTGITPLSDREILENAGLY